MINRHFHALPHCLDAFAFAQINSITILVSLTGCICCGTAELVIDIVRVFACTFRCTNVDAAIDCSCSAAAAMRGAGGVSSLIGTTLLVYYKVGLKPSKPLAAAAAAASDAFAVPGGLEGAPSLKFTPELMTAASGIPAMKQSGAAHAARVWISRVVGLFAGRAAGRDQRLRKSSTEAVGLGDQDNRGAFELAEIGVAKAAGDAAVAQDQEPGADHEHVQMLRSLLPSFVQHGSSSGMHREQQQQQHQAGRLQLPSCFTALRGRVTGGADRQVNAGVALQAAVPDQQAQQQQQHVADVSIHPSIKDSSRTSRTGDSGSSQSSRSSSGGSEESRHATSATGSSSAEASDLPMFPQQQQQQQAQRGLQRAHSTQSLPGPDEMRSLATVSAPASYWNMRNILPVANTVTNIDYVGNMLHDMGDCEELWEDAHSLAALPMLPASLVGATIHHAGITGAGCEDGSIAIWLTSIDIAVWVHACCWLAVLGHGLLFYPLYLSTTQQASHQAA
jgi:hypothetical protein